ncbi:MAG: (2Fe-2S)-binding protein [Burkholderiaceae bacterium]
MSFQLNGSDEQIDVDPAMPVLWALRDELNATGTKFGCGVAACGACTVLLDGQAIRSCVLPAGAVQGRKLATIELGQQATPAPTEAAAADQQIVLQQLQAAWIQEQVPQCGYCQSGMLMAATALLSATPAPSNEQIEQAMTNLCRCGTYQRIRRAIHRAAGKLAERSA